MVNSIFLPAFIEYQSFDPQIALTWALIPAVLPMH